MPAPDRITSESADFQLLEALLHNRRKRTQRGEFLIEGVQAINRAVAAGWPIRSVLTPMGTALSSWAAGIVAAAPRHVEVQADLFARLTDREEQPEALLVGEIVEPALSELRPADDGVVVVVDRPSSPGNLGTILRTSDALGAAAVLAVGHGAHLFDPRTVRASVGSLFSVPAIAVGGPADVAVWLAGWRERTAVTVYATDEAGDTVIGEEPLARPALLLLGSERTGLARGLRDLADVTLRIAMAGSASSLNVAIAHGIALHALMSAADH